MKTGSITELASFLNAGIAGGVQSTGKNASGESFSQIMSQAESSRKDSVGDVKAVEKPLASDSGSDGRLADSPNENSKSVNKVSDNDKKTGAKTSDVNNLDRNELEDKISNVTEEITDQIKAELDVTEEELLSAMEALGLTMVDLLDPSKVQMLYTELSGASDVSMILTDEGLYDGLKDVLEEVSQLTDSLVEELGITEEQLATALEHVSEDDGPMVTQGVDDGLKLNGNSESRVTQSLDDEVGGIVDEIQVPQGESFKYDKDSDKGEGSTAEENFFGQSSMQNNTVDNTQVNEIENGYVSENNFSAQDVSRQIVEQIRLKASADTTTLEMELNPESLGKVGLVIESKNGAITAQFSAANEFVRAAIEGQMVMLQQQLEEQGIKVEAVEVTLASHEFEQNLEHNNPGDEQQQEAAERLQKAGMRRRLQINLLNDDENPEDMTEEEAINRDMMMRNGNSVDYMA